MYDKKSKNKEPPRHREGPSCQINELYRSRDQEIKVAKGIRFCGANRIY